MKPTAPISVHITAIIAAAACLAARADVADIPASRDVTLYENMAGDTANGAGDHLFIGRTNVGIKMRTVLYFDVADAIPAGATVESATLTLYNSRTTSATFAAGLHRATNSWGEGASNAGGNEGSGAPAQLDDATWLYRFFVPGGSSIPWDTVAGDLDPTPSATINIGGDGQFYAWTSAQMADDVQNWLDDPENNHGWFVIGNETALQRTAKRFDSRTNPVPEQRPVLTVVYNNAAPCPADLAPPFGVLDLADVQAFIAGFVAQDPIADLAEPFGVYDLADVQAFIASFNAGCP